MRIAGLGSDFCIPEIAGETVIQLIDAVPDIGFISLKKGFDGSIGQVFYPTGQVVPVGNTPGSITKSHTLNTSGKNHMLCNLFHVSLP